MRVLIVEDQRSARRVLKQILAELDYVEVVEATSFESARSTLEESTIDLMLVDVRLSEDSTNRDGLKVLSWTRSSGRSTPAVMVTASSELLEVREAMRLGAQDYVLKDELSSEMLLPIVEGIHERLFLQSEVRRLRARVERTWGTAGLIGSSAAMSRVRKLVERVADADAPVLIRGQTGTGKELVARAIHETGRRRDHPFVAVNCSALPGTLIESMIFGHERGAFTGADRKFRGHFELAGSGTVLLDEIAEMPPELQAKLLRVLEERSFRPLGAEANIPLKARVLAATHVNLEERIRSGRFREDLFFRLNVVSIDVPALAERRADIPELLCAFAAEIPRKLSFTERSAAWLTERDWPGNVRELRNAVERLALLADADRVDVAELVELVGARSNGNPGSEIDRLAKAILALPQGSGSKLDDVERAVLTQALEASGGNKSAAARLIGVDRKVLDRKWERLSDRAPAEAQEKLASED